jgi:hypothetical protein
MPSNKTSDRTLREREIQAYLDFFKANTLLKIKRIEITKLTFISTFWSGLLFYSYFEYIGFFPELNFSDSLTLLLVVALSGAVNLLGLYALLVLPVLGAILLPSFLNRDDNENNVMQLPSLSISNKIDRSIRSSIIREIRYIAYFIPSLTFAILFFITALATYFLLEKYEIIQHTNENVYFFILVSLTILAVNVLMHNILFSGKKFTEENAQQVIKERIYKIKSAFFMGIALVVLLMLFYPGASSIIPRSVMRNTGWGEIKNVSIIINHEQCQSLSLSDVVLTKQDTCSEKESVYKVDNVNILLALGDPYYLEFKKKDNTSLRALVKRSNLVQINP